MSEDARARIVAARVTMTSNESATGRTVNSPAQVLFASLIGTTIEFFDFYIYATAAVLVFPRLFFPSTDPAVSDARLTRDIRGGVLCPADWFGAFRSFRRPRRPKDHARRSAADDGRVDGRYRPVADLRRDRHRGAAAPGVVPVRPGPWTWRRVGRSRSAGHRERTARASGLGTACSRSSALRSASSSQAACSWCCRRCSTTTSSSATAGGCRFSPVPSSCWSASTCG